MGIPVISQKLADAHPLHVTLLERQLLYFGHIARADKDSVLRRCAFKGEFDIDEPDKKRGRPKDTWTRKLLQHAINIATDIDSLQACTDNKQEWKIKVRKYCRAT